MAEEFGLHQGLGNGRAVDGDEGLVLAAALIVDSLGDKILAGATLALDQDGGRLAGGDLADEAQQLGHLLRDADHIVIAGATAHLAAQRFDLGAQAGGLERVFYRDRQFVEVQRLADEVVGAQLERRLHVLKLGIGGDHNDGTRVVGFL